MFTWLANLFAAKPYRATSGRAPRLVRARYDAAVTNEDNRRHWASADGLSANAANSSAVRRTLRNRARYEVSNNSYARGIVLTLANDVVGTGPRLQLLTSDPAANSRIEREFMTWAKVVRLAEKLRTMRTARAADGEAFAILTSNPYLPTSIQLDLRLVEADQVCTPDLWPTQANAVDGIVFDDAGNPLEYHVLQRHPGDTAAGFNRDFDTIPAESVLHWFRADRPGQARGIPDIMPALPLFAQLRRFTLAVLAAAETAADFAGILYTDAPANGEADAVRLVRLRAVCFCAAVFMTQVTVGENEGIESALRRFKRQVSKAGIFADLKRLRHHETPTEKYKRKAQQRRRRR